MTWNCHPEGSEPDHRWKVIKAWYGDPNVVNGTADCSFRRCRECGEEDHETPVSRMDEWDERDD